MSESKSCIIIKGWTYLFHCCNNYYEATIIFKIIRYGGSWSSVQKKNMFLLNLFKLYKCNQFKTFQHISTTLQQYKQKIMWKNQVDFQSTYPQFLYE